MDAILGTEMHRRTVDRRGPSVVSVFVCLVDVCTSPYMLLNAKDLYNYYFL